MSFYPIGILFLFLIFFKLEEKCLRIPENYWDLKKST